MKIREDVTNACVAGAPLLVLRSTRHIIEPIQTIDFSWAFVLRPPRSNYTPRSVAWFIELLTGPRDFVNAGAMLRGIQRPVERHRDVASPATAMASAAEGTPSAAA